MDSLTGQLLIAGPSLFDPNFRRTIVLVGRHDEDGAVGVVLNEPLEVEVSDAAPELAGLVEPGDRVYRGGPVQPQAAVVVADFEDPALSEVIVFGTIGFLPPDAADGLGVRRARVFAGYSGWGPGQLEAEMEENAWITEQATADDIFTPVPERLWESVVARKGRDYAFLRSMPADPSWN